MEKEGKDFFECKVKGGALIRIDRDTIEYIPECIKNVIGKTAEISEVIDAILSCKPFDLEELKEKENALHEAVHELKKFKYTICLYENL